MSVDMKQRILSGKLCIVNSNGVFDVVPSDTAEKIRQRNPSMVIDLKDEESTPEDDEYAGYEVPDDLMW